jgi:hypothetical protein
MEIDGIAEKISFEVNCEQIWHQPTFWSLLDNIWEQIGSIIIIG